LLENHRFINLDIHEDCQDVLHCSKSGGYNHNGHGVCAKIKDLYGFLQVFRHERLNGHYGVVAFVIGNTLSSLPFLFLISLLSGTIVYFMVHLHPGFNHYAYFVLMLFACLTCVESLMMAVSSVVGANFLAGIVVGAGIQVCCICHPPHGSHFTIALALIL
jgi:ABC-type multidrug transport system permease subunit